jgi:hypothetical protein
MISSNKQMNLFITSGVRRVTVCQESLFVHQLLMHENMLCYRKDEDWPLGFALQDAIPNHP